MSFDFNRLAEALIGGAARPPAKGRRPRQASLLGRGRSGDAQAVRALASLAGLAIEALTTAGQAPLPPVEKPKAPVAAPPRRLPDIAPPTRPTAAHPPAGPRAEHAEALLLIRAMVAAAAADGQVDRAERQAIAAQLDQAGLSAAERDLVLADLDRPASPETLAAEVLDPMQAAQLYAAAVAVAAEQSPAERAFLDRLCRALRLSPEAAAAIETRLTGHPRP